MPECDRQTDRVLLVPPHRSQRDAQVEQKRCLQQLRKHQEEMKNVEVRMMTAANSRQQFEYALASISIRDLFRHKDHSGRGG